MKIQSITLLLLCLMTCIKCDNPPIDQQDIWDCHYNSTWDSSKINDALIGEWEWEFIHCFWTPEDDNGDDYKGLTIEFKSNNTLDVLENGQLSQSSNWTVVDNNNVFSIDVDPPVNQLYGRILFCDDKVEFNDSYIDGCDNYFKRNE